MPARVPLLALALAAACSGRSRPLPSPANLAAVRLYDAMGCVALLSWDPVEGATSYQVSAQDAGATRTFDLQRAQMIVQWPAGDLAVAVRALDAEGPGERTPVLHAPESLPELQVSISGTTAHLSWNSEASPAQVARGLSRESMTVVASVTGSSYDDEGLTRGATCYWAVQLGQPPLSFVSAVKSQPVA